jgi:hypothetical protein
MTGTWTASVQTSGDDGVTINNTGRGLVSGIHFLGHRFFGENGNGLSIMSGAGTSPVADVTVDASTFCGMNSAESDIYAADGANIAVRNNKIGGMCEYNNGGAPANGITLGSSVTAIITGNDFTGIGTMAISGNPVGDSIVANNTRVDTGNPTITVRSAATLSLSNSHSEYLVSGTTTVTAIAGVWNGREVTLIPSDSPTFSIIPGAGSTCTSVTPATNAGITLRYNPGLGCWVVKYH